ncbi:MAG: DUF2723 domain-containing protein [Candidatus Lernaella stagnicola]|nr:DUF2723 domain-containing protein [Candidatus Lernaella stagnicola]
MTFPIRRLVFWLTGLVLLVVYLAAIAPGVFWRDSLEFCLIGHQLDIGHPAGSPTFSLLSKTLSFLPLGNLAWRANLLSALAAVAAVLLLWRAVQAWAGVLGCQDEKGAWCCGAVAALAMAFSQAFWAWGEVAEVYTLQAAALAALLWLTATAIQADFDVRRIALVGFLLGLSCGVHMAQILYIPAFAAALLVVRPGILRWRAAWWMGVAFVAGFAVFAYLPVRSLTNLPYDYGNPETWDAFIAHITGKKYAAVIHQFPWGRILRNTLALARHIPGELGLVTTLAAIVGLGVVAVRSKRGALLIALLITGHLYLYIKDWSAAFGYIPIFLLFAWIAGLGLTWVWDRLTAHRTAESRAALRPALAALAVVVVVTNVWAHGSYCCRADYQVPHRHGRAVLAGLPTGAVLVGYQDHLAYSAFYQQYIERWRDDIQFAHRAWLPFRDEIQYRFPNWDLAALRDDDPQRMHDVLFANAGSAGAYWDFGWENIPYVDVTRMRPNGMVFQLLDKPWDGTLDDRALWQRDFEPLYSDPAVRPGGFDFTAREVYSRAFNVRAKFFADRAEWSRATQAVEKAIAIRPDFADNHALLGLIHLAQGEVGAASREINRAIEIDPYSVMSLQARGQLRRHLGHPDLALEDFLTAYRLRADSASEGMTLASQLMDAGRPADAVDVLRRVERLPLDREKELHIQQALVMLYAHLGQCRKAAEYLEKAERNEPVDQGLARWVESCRRGEKLR